MKPDIYVVEYWKLGTYVGCFVNGLLKAEHELGDGPHWHHYDINKRPYNFKVSYFKGLTRLSGIARKLYKVPTYEPR